MNEECFVCQAPLEYLNEDIFMECEICHKKEMSKTRCINGHYICNECHTKGIDLIIDLCMKESSKNPITIIENDAYAILSYAWTRTSHYGWECFINSI